MSVADQVLDFLSISRLAQEVGAYGFEDGLQFLAELETNRLMEELVGGVTTVSFRLSEMASAVAAEIAEEERGGMAEARRALALPYPRMWLEWEGVECGLPGDRWGASIEDEIGLVYFLQDRRLGTADFGLAQMPVAMFKLNIGQDAKGDLLEMQPGRLDHLGVDAGRFGRFLLGALALITQPRMSEQVELPRTPQRDAVDRTRRAAFLPPRRSMKEIRLLIDAPTPAQARGEPSGEGSDETRGRALHWVRAHWRFRRAKLEMVRPHTRGDAANGVSKRLYTLMGAAEMETVTPAMRRP